MSNLNTIARTLLIIALLSLSAQAQTRTSTGDQIIQKMSAQYASVKSYQDVGVIQDGSKNSTIKVNEFKTYFVRPNLIRFEWEDADDRDKFSSIFWSDGKGVFSFYNFSKDLEKEESISSAVAGATGISRGAAHTVTRLLSTDVGGFSLTEMSRIILLSQEAFEGEDCFVVRGFHPFGFAIDVWISKRDMLIRKVHEEKESGAFTDDIRREIKINQPIPESTFKFQRPSPAKARVGANAIG
ncbi:MAG: DUF2092 domain-containing protein [Pyrinomonadaceae bacterium]